jgi:B12-binding domain/radical SAM domain protein
LSATPSSHRRRVAVVAHHARTGIVALNVVTAALDADERTAGLDVRFPRRVADLVEDVRALAQGGALPLVLWSYYSTDAARTEREFARAKAELSGVPALHVVGGVHATAEPASALRAGFDLAVLGEGEATIVAVADALARGADPHGLPGTAHLDGGRLVRAGRGPRRPLDDFPAFNVRHAQWNAIEITRGCVYACSFCQTPFAFGARFRHRSVPSVREHMRAMRRDGHVGYVRFLSPTALSYGAEGEAPALERVEELLAGVREEAGPATKVYFGTFPSEVRPEHVTPEALAIVARYADNRTLIVGGQSGSQRVLESTHRGHDVAAVERAVRVAVECGFQPDVDLLLGVPGETPEDRRATLAFAERLVALGARLHSHAFLPLPGTPLSSRAPEPIEEELRRAMVLLESGGKLYGQWRRQIQTGAELARGRTQDRPPHGR